MSLCVLSSDTSVGTTEERARGPRFAGMVRALRHHNFRLYFFGMFVSFIGTWMQRVAQSWLVYRLTGSAWWLGVVGFTGQVPVFVLALLGGVLADRYSRYRLILLTQTLALVQALVLAVLTLSGHVTVGAVLALALFLGVINAFDMPARQSFIVTLVGREDLMNAIALNSSVVNGARILGPALSGLLVAWLGEGLCFLLNGMSYVAVLVGLLMMGTINEHVGQPSRSAFASLLEGFHYVSRTRSARALLLMLAFVSLFGMPYMVLMPIFADRILAGGPRAFGVLLGAAGLGALAGALILAARHHVEGLGRVVGMSVATFGVMLMLFSLSRNLILSAALLVPVGCTLMLQMSASNTLLQAMVPDHMRGRVMSFYSLSLLGMAPFGSLCAGVVATHIGAPETVASGGALCLMGALVYSVGRLPASTEDFAVPDDDGTESRKEGEKEYS